MTPPKIEPLPFPKTLGSDAKRWLEGYGFVAKQPMIRSSDYELCLHCPFQYYLSRRLGLTPALRWSSALSRGSWFHTCAEHINDTPVIRKSKIKAALVDRKRELHEMCNLLGVIGDSRDSILQREEKDAMSACAWFDAAVQVKIGDTNKTFVETVFAPHFEYLGSEVVMRYEDSLIQADALLYHKGQNSVWIVDYKTCAESPTQRLQTCPHEFQTQHYLFTTHYLLGEGTLQRKFDLPEDARIGGMYHIAIQKPSINFGSKDRDCELIEHELQRGPRKGQIEIRRKYHGEPRYENYLKRCEDWYHATGEYEELAPERVGDPVVNISSTSGRICDPSLDPTWLYEYHRRLRYINHWREVDPVPANFLKSAKALSQHGKMNVFAPFYMTTPDKWPEILNREGFLFEDRDDVEVTV